MENKFNNYLKSGNDYYCKGDYRTASNYYSQALELNPNDPDAQLNEACCDDEIGQTDLAVEKLENIVKNNTYFALGFYNLGFLYKKKKLYSNAIKVYTNAINLILDKYLYINKSSSNKLLLDSYCGRGSCFEEMFLYDDAERDYIKSIEINPKCSYSHKNLLRINLKKNEIELAEYNAKKAFKLIYPECRAPGKFVTIVTSLHEKVETISDTIKAGFFPGYVGEFGKTMVLMPVLSDRIILHLDKIKKSKSIIRHFKKNNKYTLEESKNVKQMADRLIEHYKDHKRNIVDPSYLLFLQYYLEALNQTDNHLIGTSVSLFDENEYCAGDLGVLNGRIYTSFSGHKVKNNGGTSQLILYAETLKNKNFVLKDFGPDNIKYNAYKFKLGAQLYTANDYLKLVRDINPYANKYFY
ncbi:MAG: tetratricopeptide repeat protein [Treponema sp.]|nr:tetratricopeptide repeat protein [Treponema sp.]